MIPFKINGKEVNIPSCWDDLSFNQHQAIANMPNDADNITLAAICLKMDEVTLRKAKLENVHKLYEVLVFTTTRGHVEKRPTKIKNYILPKDVTFESVAQFEDMRKTLNLAIKKINKETDVLKIIPMISEHYPIWCAIYCQKIRDGEYDYSKAMEMVEEMRECSCMEILSAGTFFFSMLTSSSSRTRPIFLKAYPLRKKMKQAFQNFTRHLGLTSQ